MLKITYIVVCYLRRVALWENAVSGCKKMRCDDLFTVDNLGAIAAQQWDKKVVTSYPQVVIGLAHNL